MYHMLATLNTVSRRLCLQRSLSNLSIRLFSSSTSNNPLNERNKEDTVSTSSKPYIPLYHHHDPSLFSPLLPGSISYILHNVIAAFQATISLASSKTLREKFVSSAKLYGLSTQPHMQPKIIEDDDNLYSGCIINTNVVGQSDMGFINVLSLFNGLFSPLYNVEGLSSFDIKEFMDGAGFALEQFHKVDHDFLLYLQRKQISDDYDFLSVAESDHESLEYDLMKMTTPPFWTYLNTTLKEYLSFRPFLNEVLKISTPVESKIVNLALLSARVAEIENPTLDDYEDESQSSKLKQIVTQLEVLYERELVPCGYGDDVSNIVNVATFEACILGDPNGEQLQWRLCQTRPASEFPFLE